MGGAGTTGLPAGYDPADVAKKVSPNAKDSLQAQRELHVSGEVPSVKAKWRNSLTNYT